MTSIEDIISGEVSGDRKSNISHPFVKISFIIFYLTISLSFIMKRLITGNFNEKFGWFLFFAIYVVFRTDLRDGYVRSYLKQVILSLFVCLLPFLISGQDYIGVGFVYTVLSSLTAYVSLGDMVIFMHAIGAVIAINQIYSLDALWLSNHIPDTFRRQFLAFMITYFAFRRFLSESIQDIFEAASFRFRLARDKSFFERVSVYVGSITHQIIPKLRETVAVVNNIIRERGYLEDRIDKPYNTVYTHEDIASSIMLSVIAIIFSLQIFIGVGAGL